MRAYKHFIFVIYCCCAVFYFLGCDGSETINTYPGAVAVLSISESRPANIRIGGIFRHHNTCVSSETKMYADVVGKKIYLRGKMNACSTGCICGQAVTESYGEIDVKNLEVGEYSIVSPDGIVLTRLVIESNNAYFVPSIHYLYIDKPSKVLNGELYLVRVSMNFPFKGMNIGCKSNAIIHTYIDRKPDIIHITLHADIPKNNSGCHYVMNIHEQYNAIDREEINLGMFGSGDYELNINGYETSFYIPEPEDDLLK